MNSQELVMKAKNVQKNFKTTYMWGTFGSLVSETIILQKSKQYPDWYTNVRVKKLKTLVGTNTWAFDCVGFIKALLWGWNGSKTKSYGGADYCSNSVPDISADQMIQKCYHVSTDFSNILPGEVVWKQGHIGLYVGSGIVIECTSSWNGGVQCSTFTGVPGYKARKWTKHGMLPWIDYTVQEEDDEMEIKPTIIKVDGKTFKPNCANIAGNNYVKLRDIADILGYNVSAQGATPVLIKK